MIHAPPSPRPAAAAHHSGPSGGGIVLKKLAPTAPGAKRLAARYGNALVCVRYREDQTTGQRLTTVELIVETRDRQPKPAPLAAVRIAYGETELRNRVKAAGGTWDAERKLWHLPKAAIRKLQLQHRVVPLDG